MFNILKIAIRNLARFHRRTWLTSTLITLGIVAVLLFIATWYFLPQSAWRTSW